MFGYIRIYKPELKMGDYDRYQGVYCTLCRRIGQRYGRLTRFSLSYDFTFLALLKMALSEECAGFEPSHCVYNFRKKCLRCQNTDAVDYAAACAVLLLCGKLRDNVQDGGFWQRLSARLGLRRFHRAERRAAAELPEEAATFLRYETAQRAIESEPVFSLDRAAEPTANMMAALASRLGATEPERRALSRLGYCLGRFIYLADAADDYWDDAGSGGFNPWLLAHDPPAKDARPSRQTRGVVGASDEVRAHVRATLNTTWAEALTAYRLLNTRRFSGILDNIMEHGLADVIRQLLDGKEGISDERRV
ncbi:MAG: hypothetical protein IKI63_03860 [Clostridia bacterium]|nr:hypothetical protein [Clostridia bacterium]